MLAFIGAGLMTVNQGNVAVITLFGKYNRTLRAGLNFKIPFLERLFRYLSLQNFTTVQQFQAITKDQAVLYFEIQVIYSIINEDEDNIKKAAFKFVNDRALYLAMTRAIEAAIRSFVAQQEQNTILGMRSSIVTYVKQLLDNFISDWGYNIHDIQITDMVFNEEVMRSMDQVVASKNIKEANTNIGAAQVMFNKWAETMENVARDGQGNMIFFDGSPSNMDRTFKQMMGLVNQSTGGNAQ